MGSCSCLLRSFLRCLDKGKIILDHHSSIEVCLSKSNCQNNNSMRRKSDRIKRRQFLCLGFQSTFSPFFFPSLVKYGKSKASCLKAYSSWLSEYTHVHRTVPYFPDDYASSFRNWRIDNSFKLCRGWIINFKGFNSIGRNFLFEKCGVFFFISLITTFTALSVSKSSCMWTFMFLRLSRSHVGIFRASIKLNHDTSLSVPNESYNWLVFNGFKLTGNVWPGCL